MDEPECCSSVYLLEEIYRRNVLSHGNSPVCIGVQGHRYNPRSRERTVKSNVFLFQNHLSKARTRLA